MPFTPLPHFFRAHCSPHGAVPKPVCSLRRVQTFKSSGHDRLKTRNQTLSDVPMRAPAQALTQLGLDLNVPNDFGHARDNCLAHSFSFPSKGAAFCTRHFIRGRWIVFPVCHIVPIVTGTDTSSCCARPACARRVPGEAVCARGSCSKVENRRKWAPTSTVRYINSRCQKRSYFGFIRSHLHTREK